MSFWYFTLNIGLRYEIPSVLTEKRNKGTNLISGVGSVLLGTNQVLGIDTTKVGPASLALTRGPVTLSSAGGVSPDYTNVGPSIGFAYKPNGGLRFFADGKTVIRGGFRAGVPQPSGGYSWPVAFNQRLRPAPSIRQQLRLPVAVRPRRSLPRCNANRWLNQLVGGWSLSGITNIATGQPFTIISNPNVDYGGFNQFE